VGKTREPKLDRSKAGGFAFFLSLGACTVLAMLGVGFLAAALDAAALHTAAPFACGVVGGAIAARWTVRGHIAVFLHEWKHSVVANLVGNKARGWRIRRRSGHFEYEFTEKTRRYNAFIALAPYFLPVFTLAALAIAFAGWHHDHQAMTLIVGIGWGVDLNLNIRDIGPHQTDFTQHRGGFPVGVLYVGVLNAVTGIILLTWAGLGLSGLHRLGLTLRDAVKIVLSSGMG